MNHQLKRVITDIIKSQNEKTETWEELVQAVKEKVKKWIEMERPDPYVLQGPFLLYASINNHVDKTPGKVRTISRPISAETKSVKQMNYQDDHNEASESQVSISNAEQN